MIDTGYDFNIRYPTVKSYGTDAVVVSNNDSNRLYFEITGNTVDNNSVGNYDSTTGLYNIPICLLNKNLLNSEMEIGTLSSNEGLPVTMYIRLRTKDFITLEQGTYTISANLNVNVDLKCLVFEYDAKTNEFIHKITDDWQKPPFTFKLNQQRKIKFLIAKTTEEKIYPTEIKFNCIADNLSIFDTISLISPLETNDILKSNGEIIRHNGTHEQIIMPNIDAIRGNFTFYVNTVTTPLTTMVEYETKEMRFKKI